MSQLRSIATSAIGLVICLWLQACPLRAAIVQTGNVVPDINTWNINTWGYIGSTSDGSVAVNAGSILTSNVVRLGVFSGSTGTVTIVGAGSQWTNNGPLDVGRSGGNGTLTIEAGGKVHSVSGSLGTDTGSTGTATVSGPGSQWTNSFSLMVGGGGSGTLTVVDGGEVVAANFYASLSDLLGDGTITVTRGAVLDTDLVFDATHGLQQSFSFGSGGALTVNYESGGSLGVGYKQSGSLTVTEGAKVSSTIGLLGRQLGSTGIAMVTGAGSTWTNSELLHVGYYGSGTLILEAGGEVSSRIGYLGNHPGSTGAARVTGGGSMWSNSLQFVVGVSGSGALTIEAGGQVRNTESILGFNPGSMGTGTVTGIGSELINSDLFFVGRDGGGILTITSGGLVSVGGTLTIDHDLDNDAFINMATGGMLALKGDADDSLSQFLDLVEGTDAIRYWDTSLFDWAPLTGATYGDDYTLEYLTTGDLAGYTLLTVGRVGDFDNDGDVDGSDFLAWQRNPFLGSLADWQEN